MVYICPDGLFFTWTGVVVFLTCLESLAKSAIVNYQNCSPIFSAISCLSCFVFVRNCKIKQADTIAAVVMLKDLEKRGLIKEMDKGVWMRVPLVTHDQSERK